jgi:hypothetical protein
MIRRELINELLLRKNELIAELEAIKRLEETYNITSGQVSLFDTGNKDTHSYTEVKGKKSWADYVLFVLKELGERAKAEDVSNAIIKANINIIDEKTIKHAVSHHLSKLYRNKKIGAEKGTRLKDGYVYFIIK